MERQLPPWLSSLDQMIALQYEEHRAWVNAALLELDVDELRGAKEVAPADGEAEDLQTLERQLRLMEDAAQWISEHAQPDEDPSKRADRAQILERVLRDIGQRRTPLIEQALKDARRGQKRKPRSAASSSGRSRAKTRRASS